MGVEREINYKFSATENVTSVAGRVRKALKGARKSEGSEALEEIGKLARGAGVTLAFELAGRALESMAGKLGEIREASHGAKIGWDQYAEGLVTSIPVLGTVYEGIKNLTLELNGTAEAARKAEKEKAASEAVSGLLFGEAGKSNLAGKEGPALARAQAENELKERLKAIEEVRRANKKGLSPFQNKALDKAEADAKKQSAAEILKIEQDYYRERAHVIAEGEGKIREMKATNAAAAEQYAGHELEARLIELKAQRDQTKQSIKDDFDAKLKDEQDPARRQELFKQRGEQAVEAEKARRLGENQAQENERNALNQKRFNFSDKGLEFLKREGELGNAAAARDAERLQIVTEFARKRQEIADLLAKENIAPDQRSLLTGIQGGLSAQERAALARVGIGTDRFSGGIAPTQESYHLTGLAASARENDPANRIISETINNGKILAEIRDNTKKALSAPAAYKAK